MALHSAAAHGLDSAATQVAVYRPMPAPVALLGGVLVDACAGCVKDAGVGFNPLLAFHQDEFFTVAPGRFIRDLYVE